MLTDQHPAGQLHRNPFWHLGHRFIFKLARPVKSLRTRRSHTIIQPLAKQRHRLSPLFAKPANFNRKENGQHVTTILYIEDDESIRQLVRLILARRGNFELIEAETGDEGIDLAFNRKPDLIMIDITLPDMTGNEVLQRLRENPLTSAVPTIAISGNAVEETRQRHPDFQYYLAKPVRIDALYAALDTLLR